MTNRHGILTVTNPFPTFPHHSYPPFVTVSLFLKIIYDDVFLSRLPFLLFLIPSSAFFILSFSLSAFPLAPSLLCVCVCVCHLRLFFFFMLPGLLCAARPPQPTKICAQNSSLLTSPSYCVRICVCVWNWFKLCTVPVPVLCCDFTEPLNWPKHNGVTVRVDGIRFQSHTWLKCRWEGYRMVGNRGGKNACTVRICQETGWLWN